MPQNEITLEVVAKTDTGMVRATNEDNFIISDDCQKTDWILPKGEYNNSVNGTLIVVADGMGGLNAGEVASQTVIESVHNYFLKCSKNGNVKTILIDAVSSAHEGIIKHSKQFPETEGMGSTVVMAWIKNTDAHIVWVGDSRCYLLRNEKMIQLSKDHSYVQSLIDDGKITKEQAFHHPESNIITQSLGDSLRTPRSDYVKCSLADGDILLLCSDGLNGMLVDDEIGQLMSQQIPVASIVDMLIEKANTAGGVDNITAAAVKIISGAGVQVSSDDLVATNDKQLVAKKKTTILWIMIALLAFTVAYLLKDRLFPKAGGDTVDQKPTIVTDTTQHQTQQPVQEKPEHIKPVITSKDSNKNLRPVDSTTKTIKKMLEDTITKKSDKVNKAVQDLKNVNKGNQKKKPDDDIKLTPYKGNDDKKPEKKDQPPSNNTPKEGSPPAATTEAPKPIKQ